VPEAGCWLVAEVRDERIAGWVPVRRHGRPSPSQVGTTVRVVRDPSVLPLDDSAPDRELEAGRSARRGTRDATPSRPSNVRRRRAARQRLMRSGDGDRGTRPRGRQSRRCGRQARVAWIAKGVSVSGSTRRRCRRRIGVSAIVATVALIALIGVPTVGAASVITVGNRWPPDVVSGFSTPTAEGFWLLYEDGYVATYGDARYYGSALPMPLNGPIVGGSVARSGTGYWLVGSDGGIFTYGSARFYGSMGAAHLNQPVFSMALTRDGHGYWLVARDGGIFTFGDAHFYGSTAGMRLREPIVGIERTESGHGYRLVARDGGIFTFGDARFFGSLPSRGIDVSDVAGMARTPSGDGYWVARSNGQVYAFGKALVFRDYVASSCDPVTAIFSDPVRQGYRLVMRSGATISFGAFGSHATGTVVNCRNTR
jgi:hypothetical protein